MSQLPLKADSRQLEPQSTGIPVDSATAEQLARLNNELVALRRQTTLQIKELEQANQELAKEVAGRKNLAEEFRKCEAQLNEAQELANLGSWEYEPDTDTVWWSEQMCRMFQIDPRTTPPTYELFLSLIHPEDRESVKALSPK